MVSSSCQIQNDKPNLLDLSQTELEALFDSLGERHFKVNQLYKWVYQREVTDFNLMTDFSKSLRSYLAANYSITFPELQSEQISQDGTIKWLFKIPGGSAVETVYIPEEARRTLCISSQVGCMLSCTFCCTAQQGFNRNLTSSEIIGQLWLATKFIKAKGLVGHNEKPITNVVMMGMGEPLLNFNNVVSALKLMLDDNAYGMSKRRVTVSTSGLVPYIDKLVEECDVALAISLHATNDKLRDELVPINKKYPIAALLDSCKRYIAHHDRDKHIIIEYVMLAGVNDSLEHAKELVHILNGINVKINLIPFNPFSGTKYQCSSKTAINRFKEYLISKSLFVTVRKTRGDDIDGACGQLAGEVKDLTKRSSRIKAKQIKLVAESV